jgi:hypothetical protein
MNNLLQRISQKEDEDRENRMFRFAGGLLPPIFIPYH